LEGRHHFVDLNIDEIIELAFILLMYGVRVWLIKIIFGAIKMEDSCEQSNETAGSRDDAQNVTA
jgi:hypothetical protein